MARTEAPYQGSPAPPAAREKFDPDHSELARAEALERFVASAAALMDLPVAPEWLTGIAQQLETSLRMTQLVERAEIAEDQHSAAIYGL